MTVNREIMVGEVMATKMKNYLYADVAWSAKLACQIGHELTHLKIVMRPFYPDADPVNLLQILALYPQEDLQEALATPIDRKISKMYLTNMVTYELSTQAS